MENKYSTIQEYLSKLLYPSLNKAVEDLLNYVRDSDFYDHLVKEFNQNYYENKREKLLKEKELLKLERGSEYSEADYEYFIRLQGEGNNESKSFVSNNSGSEHESNQMNDDFDPDFDNTQGLSIDGNESQEEVIIDKFNPIEYLVKKLREFNLNKHNIPIDDIPHDDESVNEYY